MKIKIIGISLIIGLILGVSVYYLFLKPVNLEISTMNTINERFSKGDDFVLVIGESMCGTCQDLRDETLNKYVNQKPQIDIVLVYKDRSFANETEFNQFLNQHQIEYNSSPTTYYIHDGVLKGDISGNIKTGFLTFIELEEFITKNKGE